MKIKKHIRGSVSLLLALVTVPMLVFGGIAADIALISAARSEAEGASELAINGILSEYCRKLYDLYGLIASSQTAEEASLTGLAFYEASCDGLSAFDRQDLYTVLQTARFGGQSAFSDLLHLTPTDFGVEPVPASSPANPTVLENQILSFMKVRGPLVLGENLAERFHLLDTLETQSKTASAKLKHDNAMAQADEAARALYESVQAYFETLNDPMFSPDVKEGMQKAYEEDNLLLNTQVWAESLCSSLEKESSSIEALALTKETVDSGSLLFWAGEVPEQQKTEIMQTLPRLMSGYTVYQASRAYTAQELSDLMKTQVQKAAILRENTLQIREMYSSAIAVRNTVQGMTEEEKTALCNAGVDTEAALGHALSWISSAEYLFQEYPDTIQILSSLGNACKTRAEDLEKRFADAVARVAEKCKAIPTAADTLLTAISEYEGNARQYEALLQSLPEDTFKQNLMEEYQAYTLLFDGEKVRTLKQWAEETCALWEMAAGGPTAAAARAAQSEHILDRDEVNRDTPVGTLLADFAERYKNGKQEGDKSLLNAIKNLVSNNKNADEAKETGSLKRMSEGDVTNSFGLIEALAVLSQTADISALEEFTVGGEDSSDSDISESAASGLGAVAALFSGLGKALSDMGDNVLEIEYLAEMFSCAADDPKTAVSLTGNGLNISPAFGNELEYLVYGNDSFLANKTAAISSISAIRLVLNLLFAYTDSELQQLALGIATSVAGWTGFGIPIVKNVVLICLSVAETVVDMKQLMNGESVAVIKTGDTWNLSVSGLKRALEVGMSEAVSELNDKKGTDSTGKGSKEGKTSVLDNLNSFRYRDYLTLFLTLEYPLNKNAVLSRCAKLIQLNVNGQEPGFMLAGCWTLAYVSAKAEVRTVFARGVVTADSHTNEVTVDFRKMGSGMYEIQARKMAVY